LQQKWVSAYHLSDFSSGHAPGGLFILSKFPITRTAFYEQTLPGQVVADQRARALVVQVKADGTDAPLTLVTTCLDWRTSESRVDSLDYIFSVISRYEDVIFLGDMNFDNQAMPETQHVPTNYLDVWPALEPRKSGFTWDPSTNEYAKESDPSSSPSRIDRIYIKSTKWLPRFIKLVGCSNSDILCAMDQWSQPAAAPIIISAQPKPQSTVSSTQTVYTQQSGTHEGQSTTHTTTVSQHLETTPPTDVANHVHVEDGAAFIQISNNESPVDLSDLPVMPGQTATETVPQLAAVVSDEVGAGADLSSSEDGERQNTLMYPSNHLGLWAHATLFVPFCDA